MFGRGRRVEIYMKKILHRVSARDRDNAAAAFAVINDLTKRIYVF